MQSLRVLVLPLLRVRVLLNNAVNISRRLQDSALCVYYI